MEAKLGTINKHLARVVFFAAAIFSVGVTLLAALTGVTALLIATAFGVSTAAYAVQVMQPDSVTQLTLASKDRLADAA